MSITIHKSIHYTQLPKSNMIEVKEGDTISLVTYKLSGGAIHHDCDYIYLHERLGVVKKTNHDGSFTAKMESISGAVSTDYEFTIERLTKVVFPSGKMAHVLYKLN
jgi:hypothetical protein